MTSRELHVLMLEDVAADAELCERELRRAGLKFMAQRVDTRAAFERALQEFRPDLIISDFSFPTAFDGLTALEVARNTRPEVPFIFVSGTIGEDRAAEAMKRGAADYVLKGRLARLPEAVTQALERKQLREEQRHANHALRQSEAHLLEFMKSSPSLMFTKDINGCYLIVNREFCRRFGISEPDIIGKTDEEVFPPDQAAAFRANDRLVVATRAPLEFEERAHYVDGEHVSIVYKFPLFGSGNEIVGIGGVVTDVTERVKAQRLGVQHAVARVLAETVTYEETAAKLLQVTCENMNFTIGALWEIDGKAGVMRCAEIWHAPSPALEQFAAKTREIALRPGAGIAGRAWQNGTPIWIPDATANPRSPRAPYAAQADLHENLAFPITVRGEITGVVDFFGPEMREPGPELLEVFATIGTQIGQFMERKSQQQKIARLNRIYAVLSSINAAILRIRNRQELLAEACRIAVEHGSFGIAWIGTFDPASHEVTPVAWAGFGAEQLVVVGSRASARSEIPAGQGVLGHAVREKKPVFSNDIAAEPNVGGKRRQEAIRRGYRSLIVLPLMVEDAVTGILALFAREAGFFTEEEVGLLTGLAGDISFALDFIEKKDKLQYLAYYDVLTGLPNRDLFLDRLQHLVQNAIREKDRAAVLVIDLERFSLVNDSFGRHVGDAVLKEVATRLSDVIRHVDTAGAISAEDVARISHVRFAAALGGLKEGADIAHILEDRLLASLSRPFAVVGNEVMISIRVGIAVYPEDGDDADMLIKNAEAALRDAKASNTKYAFYAPAMNARIAETLLLEQKLRKALERQEFVLYYQPKVDLKTGAIVGLEALIRWNDPDSGLVPPVRFIPALEASGMILEVGRWALGRAAEDFREWRKGGLHPPRIAVNVSPIQLRQKRFVDEVREAIAGSGAELDLEITESVIMQNVDENVAKLKALRALGMGVAIDDFGTGYSSLAYLARLPITALKIDRLFIATLVSSADNTAIVSTIISLAHGLNLRVVAEGVETDEQAKLLRLLMCDEMQGYLFSKPLPPRELVELLRKGEAVS